MSRFLTGFTRPFISGGASNAVPTDIAVTGDHSITENATPGTVIGAISAVDADAGETFEYYLVDDAGGRFAIDGWNLVTGTTNLNYEVDGPEFALTLGARDAAGNEFEKDFTIYLLDGPESPFEIQLSIIAVPENFATGVNYSQILGYDPDAGDFLVYEIVADPDDKFEISGGDWIRLKNALNYEAKTAHSITIRATDTTGRSFQKTFSMGVQNVNETPTGVFLSSTTISESAAIGVVVGLLSATDPDAGATFTYSITSDPDDKFLIVGNQLRVNNTLDFATAASHPVTIRATDQGSKFIAAAFTIDVTEAAEIAPHIELVEGIGLTQPENLASGTLLGYLEVQDPPDGVTYTFAELVDANTMFGVSLFSGRYRLTSNSASNWNYEARQTASITVRATGSDGSTIDKVITFTLTDVNEPATQINFTTFSMPESKQPGDVVAVLSAVDPDGGDTGHTFSLVSDGDSKFAIVGDELRVRTGATFDWSSDTAHPVTVRATDAGGETFDRTANITVTRFYYPPTNIILTPSSVAEGASVGDVVGALTVTDVNQPDETGYTFAITADPDDKFEIDGANLKIKNTLNYEVKASHSVTIQVTDPVRGTYSKTLAVAVTNSNEQPTLVTLDTLTASDQQTTGSFVGNLSTTDPDAGDTHTYTLVSDPSGQFAISGSQLITASALTAGSYDITIRSTDAGALYTETNFTLVVSAGTSYATESQAIFDAMTSTPDATRKGHIDTLVKDLKAAGVWSKLDVFWVFAAHADQAGRVNWKNPSLYPASNSVTPPTFTVDRGFAGASANTRMTTGFNPSTGTPNGTVNAHHIMSYTVPNQTVTEIPWGSSNCRMETRTGSAASIRNHSTVVAIAAPAPDGQNANTGFLLGVRISSSAVNTFTASVKAARTGITANASIANSPMELLGDASTRFYRGSLRAASYGGLLSDIEASAYFAAIDAYMTAVGANVTDYSL